VMTDKRMPPRCPSCGGELVIVKVACPSCGAEVSGEFDACPVCRLEGDHRKVFEIFLQSRGNIRDVQRALGLSYPTTRIRVEEVFRELGQPSRPPDPLKILQRLRAGEIDLASAEKLIKGDG
jgi:hypothetical protein